MVSARAGATFSSRKISKSGRMWRVVHAPSSRNPGISSGCIRPPTNDKSQRPLTVEYIQYFRLCIALADLRGGGPARDRTALRNVAANWCVLFSVLGLGQKAFAEMPRTNLYFVFFRGRR